MVDEDFVMGYVCGYNDGGGGGSSGSPIPEIVLDNVYYFGSSEYGVGTINYAKSNCCHLSTLASWVTEPGPNGRVWGPPTNKTYFRGYVRMKGDKIIGVVISNLTVAVENSEWSYETGAWVKTSGNTVDFGECKIVKSADSTEYNEKYNIVFNVDGVDIEQNLVRRSADEFGWNVDVWYGGTATNLMPDSDYTAWITALSKNGITLEEV